MTILEHTIRAVFRKQMSSKLSKDDTDHIIRTEKQMKKCSERHFLHIISFFHFLHKFPVSTLGPVFLGNMALQGVLGLANFLAQVARVAQLGTVQALNVSSQRLLGLATGVAYWASPPATKVGQKEIHVNFSGLHITRFRLEFLKVDEAFSSKSFHLRIKPSVFIVQLGNMARRKRKQAFGPSGNISADCP